MIKDGILTKLDKNQATEWLNSFVVVRKPSGKFRICLDPTDLILNLNLNGLMVKVLTCQVEGPRFKSHHGKSFS